jgi:STE24 endopeptidase
VAGLVWVVLLLGGLAWTGWSLALRDLAEAAASLVVGDTWRPGVTVVVYVLSLLLLNEIGRLPLGFYGGYVIERRYGMSNEAFWSWAADQVKSFGITLVLGCGAATVVYALIRLSPAYWWISAGALFVLCMVGLTNLAPVLLLPLFYSVKPLDRGALRARLLTLAERAGARVLGAYEWGLSEKT